MAGFRRLPIRAPTKHVIVDIDHYPMDKHYCELGVRNGWLKLYRIVKTKRETEYQYTYTENHLVE